MKAIKIQIQKFSRPLVILMATVVAIITSIVVANATQTITTPNAVKITYNLASGGDSAPITPVTNTSVLVMGCCTTSGGVGQVALQHRASFDIEWVGLESGNSTITSGNSGTAGTHIVSIDGVHNVEIQVASKDTIKIHNFSAGTQAGNVTLIW
jgi:hypothetical protein